MARFYHNRVIEDGSVSRYFASAYYPTQGVVEVEVSEELHDALIDLQREFWRLDRRESRHTLHLEVMTENALPARKLSPDPASILVARVETDTICAALGRISPLQRRRFLMRYLLDLPIKQIACLEKCSDRAIKYSLALARKNLREILAG